MSIHLNNLKGILHLNYYCYDGNHIFSISLKNLQATQKRVDNIVLTIRPETNSDERDIANVIALAFADHPMSNGEEVGMVARLRDDNALTLSLVAIIDDAVVGHIAFSTVTIDGKFCGWYGLAPVSVLPQRQHKGVGFALINEGLAQLQQLGAKGCVLLGEPEYYSKFGFQAVVDLVLAGVPPEYFQALSFGDYIPSGMVKYHAAFG